MRVYMCVLKPNAISYRNFKPDFVLVRQHLRDMADDFRPLVLGLRFGGVSGVNSLQAMYNFTDRPWVVSVRFVVLRHHSLDEHR